MFPEEEFVPKLIQSSRGEVLFQLLSERALERRDPIVGYITAANLCGVTGHDIGRPFAQVCSRVDAACFYAGMPMLALHHVRSSSGEINDKAFRGVWEAFRDEAIQICTTHIWTREELDSVAFSLGKLPDESATSIWQSIEHKEARSSGLIRKSLHRRLNKND